MRSLLVVLFAAIALVACAVAFRATAEWEPDGKRLEWPRERLPLRIEVDQELATFASAIAAGADELSARVGCPLFSMRPDANAYSIRVELGPVTASEDADGDAFGVDIGQPGQRAIVRLYAPGSQVGAFLVAQHELGHVLGLAHDLRGNTIMQPAIGDRADDALPYPSLSDRDAAALRARYCPGGAP